MRWSPLRLFVMFAAVGTPWPGAAAQAQAAADVVAPTAAPDPEVERVARELFEQGRDAYANGQFPEARELFQHSYDLSGRPGLLYNIAQASERMRDDEHALELYRAYLEAVPDASERDFVEARIVFLEERLRAQAAAAAEPESAPGRTLDLGPLPLGLMVGGGGLAAGGAVLLGVGIRGRNQVEDAPDGSDYASVRGGGERARGLGYAGQIALGLGVAAAVTGVVLFVLSDAPSEDSPAADRQLSLRLGLADVTLMGSF